VSREGGKIRWRALLGVVLLVAASALHCRRGPSSPAAAERAVLPLALSVLEVRNATPDPGATVSLDTEALKSSLRQQLEASGLILPAAAAPPSPPAAQLRVVAQVAAEIVEVGDRGKVESSVAIRLDTRPSDAPGAMNEELSATGEGVFTADSRTRRGELAQRTTERTLRDLLGGFLARMHVQVASPAELHALIRQDGPLREDAIRQVGSRQVKEEATYLLTLLHHDSEPVRDAALGALLALGDGRTVHELTHSRSMKDRREMRKILDAIAALGGDEARDYLNFVAEGHTDEEIRTMAAAARDRLARRYDAGVGQ
jgi:hypothetical protein